MSEMPGDDEASRSADRPRVLIYRDHLLSTTEGFVLAQGESLPAFRAYYAGSRRVDGPAVPADRMLLVNRGEPLGRAGELWFKLSQHPPRRFVHAITQLHPALVHAHFGMDGSLMLPLSRRLNVPLVVTFHGYDVTMRPDAVPRRDFLHRTYLRQRSRLQKEGALFIAVSGFIRDRLLEQGFPPERTIVHYIGVDTDAFRPASTRPTENLALFTGRLSPEKGPDFFVRAMAAVQREAPATRAVIVGDGPMRPELEALAERCGARIEFTGRIAHPAVREWLRRATVFCAPSVALANGQAEAFGLALIEAQACGIPVAGFATGGISEATAHGVTGLLAAGGDWMQMAHNILHMQQNPALHERMSVASRERTVRLFDLRTQSAVLEQHYLEMLRRLRLTRQNGTFPARGGPARGGHAGGGHAGGILKAR